MSDKKLGALRLRAISGPRRNKPPVRAINKARRERIEAEQELFDRIVRDIDIRRAFWLGMRGPLEPYVVYTDFDHTYLNTETSPRHLPEWKELGEYLKMQILFLVALEDPGYSFTVRIRPDLERKWIAEGKDVMDRVRREISKSLADQGLFDLAFCYVVETRARGGSRNPLHLHGFFISQDPFTAPRFKAAMETAISLHPSGKLASGYAPQSGPPVDMEPAYDASSGKPVPQGRWVQYIAKHIMRWDERVPRRRVYISREGTKTAKALWALLRTDPFGDD